MLSSGRYLGSFSLTVVLVMSVYAIAFLFQIGAPVPAEYWLYEVMIVKRNAAEVIQDAKLGILGGSAALFGYDSSRIEEATRLHTVNLALHAGLSLHYLIAFARPVLKRGDTLLLALEYEFYVRDDDYQSWFTSNVMAWDAAYFWRLPLSEKARFARRTSAGRVVHGVFAQAFAERMRTVWGRRLREPREVLFEMREIWRDNSEPSRFATYSFRRLNEHGDIRGNHGSFFQEQGNRARTTRRVRDDAAIWDRLRDFRDECYRRGIDLVIAWPAVPPEEAFVIHTTMKSAEEYVKRLGIATLGHPHDSVLEERLFFDTSYHLNENGRAIQTTKLIARLNEHLRSTSKSPR